MRLGQLARKTNQKPQALIDFIKSEFKEEIGNHFNTKVKDEFLPRILAHFAPKPVEEETPVKEAVEEAPTTAPEVVTEELETPAAGAEPVMESEETEEAPTETEEEPAQMAPAVEAGTEVSADTIAKAEFIKTETTTLSGPKVVGKIDLPPPPPVKMVEVDGVMYSADELAQKRREERKARYQAKQEKREKRYKSKNKRKLLTPEQLLQEKKEREQKAMDDRIAAREKRILQQKKEAKKQAKPTYIPAKPKPKKKQVQQEIAQQKEEAPKTWYGKLWKWFNT